MSKLDTGGALFDNTSRVADGSQTELDRTQVAIIGTGFSGLGMAIRLKKTGFEDFVVLEQADTVGGTWRDNSYPGCACDIPSHLYSFSFEGNPEWTRAYPPQPEILRYLKHCADKYGIGSHIRFGTLVTEARFDEEGADWVLRTDEGEILRAQILVNGTGPLRTPARPDIPGLDGFEGACFHTAQWDHDYDLRGKRVAVIGTGASAIQVVPAISEKVEQLQVYQRSAPWIIPRSDRVFPSWERRLFKRVAPIQRMYRNLIYWRLELAALGLLGKSEVVRRFGESWANRHRQAQLEDPGMRKKCTPNDALGCKRILISDDYYPALNRPNVELVTDRIARIERDAIVTEAGQRRRADAIILGTGFRPYDFLAPLRVYGRSGRELANVWKDEARTHLGITMSGFPNLFLLLGPNSGLGHNSVVFMVEAQIHYILKCIRHMQRTKAGTVEVRDEAVDRFRDEVEAKMGDTVWMSGCRSWYLRENGHNDTLWPGFSFEYWLRTRRFHREDFVVAGAGKTAPERCPQRGFALKDSP